MTGRRRDPVTKLDAFMLKHGLRPSRVAREAGIARQHLLRIRAGTADPGIATATRIRDACARLLKRRVSLSQLFDLRKPRPVRIACRVTPTHGAIFAQELEHYIFESAAVHEAFAATGVMEWPDGYLDDHVEQDRYTDLEGEILQRVFADIREHVAAAFVAAASDVLDRVRERRNGSK